MPASLRHAAMLVEVTHRYRDKIVLDRVSLAIPSGCLAGVIGPDGAGKSTLLGLIAGARRMQAGRVDTLAGNMADRKHRRRVCPRIAYLPQGLGGNLYQDLSVLENIEYFAQLFGKSPVERAARIAQLLGVTGLAAFAHRTTGKLSGGMKQKLGLCCALIHDPDLLILDEPTTGVDPLSRRQFWDLIASLRAHQPALSVIVATAYMEEAERFDWLFAMDEGKVLAAGSLSEVKARAGAATLDEAFVRLLPESRRRNRRALTIPPWAGTGEDAIVMTDLTRDFGDFTAVDRVSLRIRRGEIFGFIGSNGCGKTTVMKMLLGLLAPTRGEASVLGYPASARSLEMRRRIGYMSQTFSLYTELTVRQNLTVHGRLFGLSATAIGRRIDDLVVRFGLQPYMDALARDLPLGVRQRLSLAVAVIHEPELLVLDEPTTGVDPLARDEFWELLVDLSRRSGVTILVSTHFMNEGARCDRVALMHDGKILANDAPQAIVAAAGVDSLEQTFIAYLDESSSPSGPWMQPDASIAALDGGRPFPRRYEDRFSWRRALACAKIEMLGFLRDPIRIAFSFAGTAILMLVLSAGVAVDFEKVNYAALDHDHTPESRGYLETFSGSRYFHERPPLATEAEMDRRLRTNDVVLAIEIPPGFGRDLVRGKRPHIAAWIDGSMPYRAEVVRGYLDAAHRSYLREQAWRDDGATLPMPAQILTRYRYNQSFKSIYAIAPNMMGMLLLLIPAVLAALAVVREKELGTITNLYVTPLTRLEFLLGKQTPYVAISMANFAILLALNVFVLDVPLKGSLPALTIGALFYVVATTGLGLFISSFTGTQIAAVVGTAVLTMVPTAHYSGLLQPVSSLDGVGRLVGELWPATYFVKTSVGAFTKALGMAELAPQLLALAAFCPVLLVLSLLLLRKQAR